LEALLDCLPVKPGVYLMKGLKGRIIYVGKAKNLKTRVRSYFRASGDERSFISRLDRVLGDIEVVITPTEKDALILERELISRHRPRYNIDLRDDKNFLSIRISEHQSFPRLMLDRKRPAFQRNSKVKTNGRWFGPYTSAKLAREAFRLVQTTFRLRTCKDSAFRQRKRPCLLHQMGRCLGPCVPGVSTELYSQQVIRAVQFLKGQIEQLTSSLQEQMNKASQELRYEDAARLRDQIIALESTFDRRQIIKEAVSDKDVVGIFRQGASGVVVLMQIRNSRWLGVCRFPFRNVEAPGADVIRQFLIQHYESGADLPGELILPAEALVGAETDQDLDVIQQCLSEIGGFRVHLKVPKRGAGLMLLKLARENAWQVYQNQLATKNILEDRLDRLKKRLRLSRLPRRIECFDMSTLGGSFSVGSMSVMIDGQPDKTQYRRFRIKEAATDSDVAMMREVVGRRMRRVLEESDDGPDLIVLDGGIGQLRIVEALLDDIGVVDVDLVALAKGRTTSGRERVYIPGRKNPVYLNKESDELFLLSRIRDEAHRFAVGYHRRLRHKSKLHSVLDEIEGVGPVIRRRLLSSFGSLNGVFKASLEELSGVPGISTSLAEKIYSFMQDLHSLTSGHSPDN
jgi:excinuclease ABC subunit C